MTTIELNLYKDSIANEIMSLEDFDVLKKIKAYVARVSSYPKKKEKESVLRGFENAVNQYKSYKEGNAKLKTLEEVIDEL